MVDEGFRVRPKTLLNQALEVPLLHFKKRPYVGDLELKMVTQADDVLFGSHEFSFSSALVNRASVRLTSGGGGVIEHNSRSTGNDVQRLRDRARRLSA